MCSNQQNPYSLHLGGLSWYCRSRVRAVHLVLKKHSLNRIGNLDTHPPDTKYEWQIQSARIHCPPSNAQENGVVAISHRCTCCVFWFLKHREAHKYRFVFGDVTS